MHFAVTIYYTIISGFKNSPNGLLLLLLKYAFCGYYILYHYFKILEIRQKFKNDPIVTRSTSQVANLVVITWIKFESYPIKTVGGDKFWKIV